MSYKRVQTYFHQLHLADRIIDLKDSSATVELAAKALGCQPQQIAKTLSFLIDEQPLLIVMAGDAKIDNKKYKQYFHKKAKMIPNELVESYIGHSPGGVCPFAVKDNVQIYLDISLQKLAYVYPAAGNDHIAIRLSCHELEECCHPQDWINVCK